MQMRELIMTRFIWESGMIYILIIVMFVELDTIFHIVLDVKIVLRSLSRMRSVQIVVGVMTIASVIPWRVNEFGGMDGYISFDIYTICNVDGYSGTCVKIL
jgi:hypothetical protein